MKTAVVTGGASGIGRAIAQRLEADGHHVATITLGAGTYTWELQGTFMPYEFGTLEVGGASGSAVSWGWDVAQWGGVGIAVVLGGLAGAEVLRRRRAVPAAA